MLRRRRCLIIALAAQRAARVVTFGAKAAKAVKQLDMDLLR